MAKEYKGVPGAQIKLSDFDVIKILNQNNTRTSSLKMKFALRAGIF